MHYRQALAGDASTIAQLHAESWRRTYRGILTDEFLDKDAPTERAAVWRERLGKERNDQFVLLAEDQGGLAGFICCYGEEDPLWGSLIDNLHVSGERRRSGAGAVLMRQAAGWLAQNYPASGVYLWVMEKNLSAQRFYQHLGGEDVGGAAVPFADGTQAPNRRYVWATPDALLRAATPGARRQRAAR
jgi:ribosomal protein S18 acetylase RimI-like enzyme